MNDKQNMAHTYNAILFSHKKENSDTCHNMDKPWSHYAKWSESDTKGHILYKSAYMKLSRTGKFIETRSRIQITRIWEERRIGRYCLMGIKVLFGMIKMFWK